MRDRPAHALAGALAAGLLACLLAAPAALAQGDPDPDEQEPGPGAPEEEPPGSWGASRFDAPFDKEGLTLRRSTFDVSGTLRYQKTGPADFIEQVEVRVVDDPGDPATPGEGCDLPKPVRITGEGAGPGLTAEQPFHVEDVTVACNGRYLVQAEGTLEDPDAPPYTMERAFVVDALPEPVTGLGLTLDGQARAVTATFQPPAEEDVAPDAVGYVLERRGPSGDAFVDVDAIGVDDEPRLVDPLTDAPAGDYTYRVRAVRAGVDGELRSSASETESDTVTVEGEPPPSTSTPTGSRRGTLGSRVTPGGRLTIPRPSSRPRLSSPTTLDTGFEDTLDYGAEGGGDQLGDELAGDEPVAGRSVIQDEGDGQGADLAVPAAGALVMLGWAGHIIYLNRLAKHL